MKYALLLYVALVALALTLHSAPQKKGPECGPGVLCIRSQREVQTAVPAAPQRYTEQSLSSAKSQ